MEKKTLNIETVHQCNCCLGYKTLHPLVSVIDLSPASLEQRTVKCGFYTIILIEGEAGDYAYGRKYYDYSNASLIFRTPGESIKLDTDNLPARKGRLLAFHPDLIACTALAGTSETTRSFSISRTNRCTFRCAKRRKSWSVPTTSGRSFSMP